MDLNIRIHRLSIYEKHHQSQRDFRRVMFDLRLQSVLQEKKEEEKEIQ